MLQALALAPLEEPAARLLGAFRPIRDVSIASAYSPRQLLRGWFFSAQPRSFAGPAEPSTRGLWPGFTRLAVVSALSLT